MLSRALTSKENLQKVVMISFKASKCLRERFMGDLNIWQDLKITPKDIFDLLKETEDEEIVLLLLHFISDRL
jgi:hypothetical protein